MPMAWVSLDSGDSDPARFWSYVVSALESIHPGFGNEVSKMLLSPDFPPMEELLNTLLNEVSSTECEFALVLDDYHLINSRLVHDGITYLLEHAPPHMHLVIISRVDPPLPISRLRARGELFELRGTDLRFTRSESNIFLVKMMGLDISSDKLKGVHDRTEGWIAALQLAAISMQDHKKPGVWGRVVTGENRFVLDYLAEEVLRAQSEEVQDFLLKTSILDRMSGPLCDSVTGLSNGQTMLEYLDHSNLLIVPLDDQRRWYRYHHLLSDFLSSRLAQQQDSKHVKIIELEALHLRASEWYEEMGMPDGAVRHALAASDTTRTARLVGRVALSMIMAGARNTVQSWLDTIPEEYLDSNPRLCIAGAWVRLLSGDLGGVEPKLIDAERLLADQGQDVGEAQAMRREMDAIRAYYARNQGDLSRTIELSFKALEQLPEDDFLARSCLGLNLGYAHWLNGNVRAAEREYEKASANGLAAHDYYSALLATSRLARIQMLQGRMKDARQNIDKALNIASEREGEILPAVGEAYVCMGELLREWNELDEAERYIKEGIDLCRQGGISESTLLGYIALGLIKYAKGQVDEAFEALQKANEISFTSGVIQTVIRTPPFQVRLWIAEGNLVEAEMWVTEEKLDHRDEISYLKEEEHIALARLLIEMGLTEEALSLIRRLCSAAEDGGRGSKVIELLSLEALALFRDGDAEGAIIPMQRSLSLAETEGYVRIFVDLGDDMAAVLRFAASKGIMLDYISRLLPAFDRSAGMNSAYQPSAGPLSERELEVMRLISTGLSNKDIAGHLVVTLGTVKTHINNIYRKLDTQSRTQAVARARELELI